MLTYFWASVKLSLRKMGCIYAYLLYRVVRKVYFEMKISLLCPAQNIEMKLKTLLGNILYETCVPKAQALVYMEE